MKETVTEYDTQEVKKTVTDYETHEIETEQYVSDLTGDVIDEDELITLHANPEIKDVTRCGYSNHRHIDIIDPRTNRFAAVNRNHWAKEVYKTVKDDLTIRSTGELHVSVSEFAELADIDDNDIGVDDELPEAYVETAKPEVNPLFNDMRNIWIIAALCIVPLIPVVLVLMGVSQATGLLFMILFVVNVPIGGLALFFLFFEYFVDTPQF